MRLIAALAGTAAWHSRRRASSESRPPRRYHCAGPIHRAEDQEPRKLRIARHVAGALQVVDHLLPEFVIAILERDDAAAIGGRERAPVVEQHRDEVVVVFEDGAELRADQPRQLLLGRQVQRHHLFDPAQPLGEALLHHGDQNVLLGLEVIERAARMHARRARDVADGGAVESLFAEQPAPRRAAVPRAGWFRCCGAPALYARPTSCAKPPP